MNRTDKIIALIILGFVLIGLSTISGGLFGQENSKTTGYALVIPAVSVFVYALILVSKIEPEPISEQRPRGF